MCRLWLLAVLMAVATMGQTRVDIQRQGKGTAFLAAPFAKPLRSGASLPLTCTVNELFFLTTALPGANIHVCYEDGEWASQGSAGLANLSLLSDGQLVGAKTAINLVPGEGISQIITVMPSQFNVQQSVNTAVLMTNAAHQAGQSLSCVSQSASPTAYNCGMLPMLEGLTAGMVLYWRPDVDNAAGPVTLEVDVLGPKPLRLADGVAEPRGGDFVAGRSYPLWYDGAAFRVFEAPQLNDYLELGAYQSGTALYCESQGGSGSSYGCPLDPASTAYTTGMVVHWRPDVDTSGGTTTIALGGLGSRSLKLADGVTDPEAGELRGGQLYQLWYDGMSFRVAYDSPAKVLSRTEHQAGTPLLCVSNGTIGQGFACEMTPTLAAYTAGQVVHWIPDIDATGEAATLNVDGLGGIPIRQSDGQSNPAASDFEAGELRPLWFDGTSFRLITTPPVMVGEGPQPACELPIRGRLWLIAGANGEADRFSVCAKDSADAFAWRELYP